MLFVEKRLSCNSSSSKRYKGKIKAFVGDKEKEIRINTVVLLSLLCTHRATLDGYAVLCQR